MFSLGQPSHIFGLGFESICKIHIQSVTCAFVCSRLVRFVLACLGQHGGVLEGTGEDSTREVHGVTPQGHLETIFSNDGL